MFSLSKFVDEQLNFFGDVMDKRPSQVSRSSSPLSLLIDDTLPLKTQCEFLLQSELASQVCWAIANIAKLESNGEDCTDLVQQIPKFFVSKSARIELTAALTARVLLQLRPNYTHIFLKPTVERVRGVPAIEYAQCLDVMIPAVSSDEAVRLLPVVEEMFDRDEPHQLIACHIMQTVPVDTFPITVEVFSRFLTSVVFTEQFLVNVAARFAPKFGDTWFKKELPEQLMVQCQTNAKIRYGTIIFLLENLNDLLLPNLYSSIVDLFKWGQSDSHLNLTILQHSQFIRSSRFSDLMCRVYPILNTVTDQIELVQIFAAFPYLFDAPEPDLKSALTSLASSSDLNIRVAFITKIEDIYKNAKPKICDHLVALFLDLCSDQAQIVREKAVQPFMFIELAQRKPSTPAMTAYLSLLEAFNKRWRFVSKLLEAVQQFPLDFVEPYLKRILTLIESAVTTNPQALEKPVTSFYVFVVHSSFATMRLPDFLKYLSVQYGQSRLYQLRSLFISIAGSLIDEFDDQIYVDEIWPVVCNHYASEKVVYVQSRVLHYLNVFGDHFRSTNSINLSKNMSKLIENYNRKDPVIAEQMSTVKLQITPQRSLSASNSMEKLPQLRLSSPTSTKQQTDSTEPRRATLRVSAARRSNIPMIATNPNSKRPLGTLTTRLSTTGMVKSSSIQQIRKRSRLSGK